MTIANYISDLLYRYECVIIPQFGGFITTRKATVFNKNTNTFYPPSKAISFNANLKHNDGLLANYIVKARKCSYDEAVIFIDKAVNKWQKALATQNYTELDKIGSFILNTNKKIIFEPLKTVNYLKDSYGLSSLIAAKVSKEYTSVAITGTPVTSYLKYAAVFVLGLSTIGFGNKFYREYKVNQQTEFVQKQQKAVQRKIQAATFTISNPLPSITLRNTFAATQFYVVAGAFREPSNADRKLKELITKGFDAAIIGKNKWQLTQVVFGSYTTKKEATKQLYKIRATEAKDAWLLVKKH